MRIIAANNYAKNLIKYAYIKREIPPFDIAYNYEEKDYVPDRVRLTKCYEIEMFRKRFFFRELNPTPLTYLQQLKLLDDFLTGAKIPKSNLKVFANILDAIINGIEPKDIDGKPFKNHWIMNNRVDISEDIRIYPELLEFGESATAEEKKTQAINKYIAGV